MSNIPNLPILCNGNIQSFTNALNAQNNNDLQGVLAYLDPNVSVLYHAETNLIPYAKTWTGTNFQGYINFFNTLNSVVQGQPVTIVETTTNLLCSQISFLVTGPPSAVRCSSTSAWVPPPAGTPPAFTTLIATFNLEGKITQIEVTDSANDGAAIFFGVVCGGLASAPAS